ncbi:Maf-like protein [Neorhizobium galegae]|uniref:Maf-like protein n=1 Tax=Neorhizobium galegae TaxID=399 RepID=UPI0006220669|nr:Maf-like protein [Neorhizobium galegae]CDZ30008.1 Maf-like protein yceF 1 [Neorhizobium galegae bv. officinalis]KAA9385288.1 Maf-like protein [Neorhizobium galegae]KAB1109768.1 Maf-like protein [Neorhizobium galegae]MCM2501845.1 Maf-like protein [Neorhizobium galegae]MCQ1771946.1 Maf-like protein [Neorhizobium galegae]
MTVPLVLASSSPFRRMLMENAGLAFESRAAEIDERKIEAGLEGASPDQVALTLAKAKALEVTGHFPGALVIGSDQTMSLGSRVYHKPKTLAEAKENLLSLSNKTHRLNSAIAFARDGEIVWEHVAHADLTVRGLSETFVDRYLSRVGEKVYGSVGAYQLEGEGIQLFSRIEGDYFTILGLPMLPLLEKLRDLGAIDG